MRPFRLGSAFRYCTSVPTNSWVAGELTFDPVTTTSSVLLATVFANWAEIRLDACTDSSWLPVADPSFSEVELVTVRMAGISRMRARTQATTTIRFRL